MKINAKSIIDDLMDRLSLCKGTWPSIARTSGVPYHTLVKIAQGQVSNPRVATVQRLLDYFNSELTSKTICSGQGSDELGRISVLDTLRLAKRELIFVGGCTLTDRPDLPLSPETSWTMDFTRVLGAIDDAIEAIGGTGS